MASSRRSLIRNAVESLRDHSVQAPHLRLAVAVDDDRVRFEVQDNGRGIAPELRSRLFGQGVTTKPGGLGLGLHTSALIAQELGGTLTAHSEGEGLGARFVLDLPSRTSVDAESASTSTTGADLACGSGLRIGPADRARGSGLGSDGPIARAKPPRWPTGPTSRELRGQIAPIDA